MADGFALWVTGLPGSGKSSLAAWLAETLRAKGFDAVLLSMDQRRKAYFPEPRYTPEERDTAYRLFAEEAAALAREGKAVVLDATAHKLAYRQHARSLIRRFAEIHVQCSLAIAMAREAARPEGKIMTGLYAKALERQAKGKQFPGLGEVVGVDAPFEEDPAAQCLIVNDAVTKGEAREQAWSWALAWLGRNGLTPAAG
jgi:adenylylsulfate kinase-like enzyme